VRAARSCFSVLLAPVAERVRPGFDGDPLITKLEQIDVLIQSNISKFERGERRIDLVQFRWWSGRGEATCRTLSPDSRLMRAGARGAREDRKCCEALPPLDSGSLTCSNQLLTRIQAVRCPQPRRCWYGNFKWRCSDQSPNSGAANNFLMRSSVF
jgi:hypothetical protein